MDKSLEGHKIVWLLHKCRHIDQCNKESKNKLLYLWATDFFDKGAKKDKWRKNSLFSNCYWYNWIST